VASPMRDDDRLVVTDEQPVFPEPAAPYAAGDADVPEPDALDQSAEVARGSRPGRPSAAFDAPEADALEQATDLPVEADVPEPPAPG